MGCFPCSSSYKKQYKKRKNHDTSDNINNNALHRSTRNINDQNHAQISPPDAITSTRLSPPQRLVKQKDGPAEVVSSSYSSSDIAKKASDANDYSTTPDSSPADQTADDFKAKKFPLDALVVATQNFNEEYVLGEGGFGKVYKGRLQDTGEVVAIKQLNTDGCQGIREFVVEVLTLSNAKDPNLVKLIGYCVEGDQRLLIYEYMPLGSLEDHLHGPRANRKLLDWNTRMKIVVGAAKGLQYLHNKMNPPIIYRDLKCSNILLGEGYNPKLSDFGLAKVGPTGNQTHVSTRVMGTYGYCAPEYAATGYLTFKSDIYSFGVFLLEIITGRRAMDNRRHGPETNLAIWAKPMFKDRKQFRQMADPALEGKYPVKGLYQALAIAAMCTNDKPALRPLIDEIVTAFSYLASQIYDPNVDPIQNTHRRANSSRRYLLDREERCASQLVESERRTKSES